MCMCVCVYACTGMFSVASNTLQAHGLQPTRFPCTWNSPGKNPGVGSHSLLQRIFPTQGLNPGLLHCRQILYPWATMETIGSRETSEEMMIIINSVGGKKQNKTVLGQRGNGWEDVEVVEFRYNFRVKVDGTYK